MANYTEEQWNAKKAQLMEKCFNGFAELGLHGTGIRTLAQHCGYNTSMIYTYFDDLDDLIVQSTEYCMTKRGSWNGIKPTTRIVESRKVYDRNRIRQADRRNACE